MNRIAILLPLFLWIVLPMQAQQKQSDLREQNLQGKVKSVEEWEYGDVEIIAGKGVYVDEGTEVVSHHLSQFNRRGNLAEETSFDSEGKMIGKSKYKYSEVGVRAQRKGEMLRTQRLYLQQLPAVLHPDRFPLRRQHRDRQLPLRPQQAAGFHCMEQPRTPQGAFPVQRKAAAVRKAAVRERKTGGKERIPLRRAGAHH